MTGINPKMAAIDRDEMIMLLDEHGSQKKVAQKIGVARTTLRNHCKRLGLVTFYHTAKSREVSPDQLEGFFIDEGGHTARANKFGIRTLRQLIEAFDIDEDEWYCERFKPKLHIVHMGKEAGHEGLTQGYGCEASFVKREWSSDIARAKRWFEKLGTASPKVKRIKLPESHEVGVMIGMMDQHLGKIACYNEQGEKWGTDEAMGVSYAALDRMAEYCKAQKAAKIWMPIGNDFLHVDNRQKKTSSMSHMQDVSCNLPELQDAGEEWLIDSIKKLAEIAPVEVIGVQGNHDIEQTRYMASVLFWAFKGNKNVTVDRLPQPRKYRKFGKVCLGWAHWQREKKPFLFAAFMREALQRGQLTGTEYHELFSGHLHKMTVDEEQGIRLRRCPSLSPLDVYHDEEGYYNQRAADAYRIDPQYGVTGTETFKIPAFLPPEMR